MLFAAVLWLIAQPALAKSVCVTCDGPVAVYSCSYAPDASGHTPNKSNRALQFACIQDVARLYQHASCSVRRNQLGECNGQVHMMSQAPPQAPPTIPDQQAIAADGPAQPAVVPVKKPREPKTVIEMAKRTARNTKKQIDKSARTVTKAARSTWRCVSTLFSKC